MCTPTTGSPTITLFQLRSNYHTLLNSQTVKLLKFINKLRSASYLKYYNLENEASISTVL